MKTLNLKSDFAEASLTDWQALVEKGLRGSPFETLNHLTEDGISRGPLKRTEDLPASLAKLARTNLPLLDKRDWHIAAPVRDPDLNHANKQLLEDLKGGASFVKIENANAIKSRSDLKRLLEGVFTDLVPIQITPDSKLKNLTEIVSSIDGLENCELALGLNPISQSSEIKNALGSIPQGWRLMGIDAAKTHEDGGTTVQELAVMAASIAEAMRYHGGDAVCEHLVIDLAADCDTHLTIAKFRTARRLVRRIAEAFGADDSTIPIFAVTSLRMMQTEDAWTNLLRVMSAGFGAVLGGADAVTTRPFTDGLGHATSFAHRIARNMQLMMMEESQLGQVSDPAHGSYWHENITENLALGAWEAFQYIEASGGLTAFQESGKLQTVLDKTILERTVGNEPILGVTLHPDENVKAPEVRS